MNDVNMLHPSCQQQAEGAEGATETPMEVGDNLGDEVVRERDTQSGKGRDRAIRIHHDRVDRGARRERNRDERGQGRWVGRRRGDRDRDHRRRHGGPRRN